MTKQYLEDFAAGQADRTDRLQVDKGQILAFASQFDPQPHHLDEEAARKSVFKGLAASGWHTAAMTMRLLVESEFEPADGILGMGLEELSWPRPVRPGDELRVESEVLVAGAGSGSIDIRGVDVAEVVPLTRRIARHERM